MKTRKQLTASFAQGYNMLCYQAGAYMMVGISLPTTFHSHRQDCTHTTFDIEKVLTFLQCFSDSRFWFRCQMTQENKLQRQPLPQPAQYTSRATSLTSRVNSRWPDSGIALDLKGAAAYTNSTMDRELSSKSEASKSLCVNGL